MTNWHAIEWGSVANWVSGIGSITASCVALYLANYSRRIRLDGYFGHRLIVGGGGPQTEIVSISVTNVGQRATIISNIGFRVGLFRKRHAVITLFKDQWGDGIPKELTDGARAHWGIPLTPEKNWIATFVRDILKTRLDIETLVVQIHTTNGGTTNIRPEKEFRKMLWEEMKRQRAATQ